MILHKWNPVIDVSHGCIFLLIILGSQQTTESWWLEQITNGPTAWENCCIYNWLEFWIACLDLPHGHMHLMPNDMTIYINAQWQDHMYLMPNDKLSHLIPSKNIVNVEVPLHTLEATV